MPHLYSYTLAAIAKGGIDLVQAGLLESLLCFALNGLLAALLTLRLTGSRVWAILAAILVVTSDSVLRAHTFALSEPLFITGMLVTLLLLTYAIERQEWYFPAAAGLLVSLTYLTRYIGFSLLGTGMLALFVFSRTWKERLIKVGLVPVVQPGWR